MGEDCIKLGVSAHLFLVAHCATNFEEPRLRLSVLLAYHSACTFATIKPIDVLVFMMYVSNICMWLVQHLHVCIVQQVCWQPDKCSMLTASVVNTNQRGFKNS